MLQLTAVRRIAVGSANPVKLAAARAVFARVAPGAEVVGVAVPSGVPDQPFGDEQTARGARTRAEAARLAAGAELGVGFEGGVVEEPDGGLRSCAWAAVAADGVVSVGGSLAMPLPPAIARRVRAGEELGHAVDAVTGERGTKHRGGAVGVLTGGLVDRQAAYEGILSYALARFLSPALWSA